MRWEVRPLGEIALTTDYVSNGSFASLKENVTYQNEKSFAVLLRTTDFVKKWKKDFVYVDESSFNFLKKSVVEVGDLVISNVGNPGIVFLAPDLGQPMTMGPNAVLVRCNENCTNSFLLRLFQAPIGREMISGITTGTTQLKFNKTNLRTLPIPIPPLDEQKRIAGILDEADRLRKKTQALIDKYDELAQSLFLDMFGGLFKDSTIPLGDLVEFSQGIQMGLENQRLRPQEGFERFLRIIDFTQGDDLRFVPQVDEKYRVKNDDIVMVRYGTVGFVGTNKEGVLANNLFKINYDRKQFNQMFLFHVFQHVRFKRFIEKEAYGATMPALSFKVMRTYDIPCPSLKMQNVFAEQIGFINGLKGTASNSFANSAKLFNALLQKAFKGELT